MPEPANTDEFNAAQLPDYLRMYYKRLFPHKQFYRWLSYNLCEYILGAKRKTAYYANKIILVLAEDGIFTHREFSFTMQDDIYIRYLSFENQSELEREICAKLPYKIDIGKV